MNTNTKGALLGLSAFALLTVHDVFAKLLGSSYTPFQILFFTVLFSFPILTLLLIRDGKPDTLRPRHPWWGLLRVTTMITASSCIVYSFSVLPLTQTYAIVFTVPLFITVLSVPLLGERIRIHRISAVLLGLVGVIIVLNPAGTELRFGHLTALIGSFAAAMSSVIVRKIGRTERDVVLLLLPLLGSFAFMGGMMLFSYVPMPMTDLLIVALMSLMSFVALYCTIGAYKVAEAVVVAPMQYSQIIWAVGIGLFLFDEVPLPHMIFGVVIVILSGSYILIRESQEGVSKNAPVLKTRSKITAGVYQLFGTILRTRGSKKNGDRTTN